MIKHSELKFAFFCNKASHQFTNWENLKKSLKMTKLSKIIIRAIVIVIAVFLTTLSDGSEKAEKSKVYVLIIAAVVCLWIQTRPTMKIEANKEITKKKIINNLFKNNSNFIHI